MAAQTVVEERGGGSHRLGIRDSAAPRRPVTSSSQVEEPASQARRPPRRRMPPRPTRPRRMTRPPTHVQGASVPRPPPQPARQGRRPHLAGRVFLLTCPPLYRHLELCRTSTPSRHHSLAACKAGRVFLPPAPLQLAPPGGARRFAPSELRQSPDSRAPPRPRGAGLGACLYRRGQGLPDAPTISRAALVAGISIVPFDRP